MRKRKDEEERKRIAQQANALAEFDDDSNAEESMKSDTVTLRVRLEGKKKIHQLEMNAEDSLSMVIDKLPCEVAVGKDFQITCVAKKLIVKSGDNHQLSQNLNSLGLAPTASLVIKVGSGAKAESSSSLKERVAAQKNLKKGSHSMHSIGLYAKDDNVKGNLVDGGGGVMYEQEVTDDEDEGAENIEIQVEDDSEHKQ